MSQSVGKALQILMHLGAGPGDAGPARRRASGCTRRPCCGCCARRRAALRLPRRHPPLPPRLARLRAVEPRPGAAGGRAASPPRTWPRSTARTGARPTCPSCRAARSSTSTSWSRTTTCGWPRGSGCARPCTRPRPGRCWSADLPPAELESVLAGVDVRPDDPEHHHHAGGLPGRTGAGARAGLGPRPRGERDLDQLHRRPGARARRPGRRGGVGVGARHRPDLRRAAELLPSLLTVTDRISRDCGWRSREPGPRPSPRGRPAVERTGPP